jgi:hypothetical protein
MLNSMQFTSTALPEMSQFHLSGRATGVPILRWYVLRTKHFPPSLTTHKVEFFYNYWDKIVGIWDYKFATASLAAGGQDYLTITTLSTRQAYGAVQLCGTSEKPYIFLKEISSDGNIQTVDVVFPAMPIFLWSNPIFVKYLLDPLFENQEAGRFPQTYAMHDLGSHYPQAIGHSDGGGGTSSHSAFVVTC